MRKTKAEAQKTREQLLQSALDTFSSMAWRKPRSKPSPAMQA